MSGTLSSKCKMLAFVRPTISLRKTLVGKFGNRHVPVMASITALPMLIDFSGSSIETAVVEVFDGTTVVDPVVVSNVFWTGLSSKLLSLLVGQFLASVVFIFLVKAASSQVSKLGETVAKTIGDTFMQQETGGLKKQISEVDLSKLALCIAIDIVGSASEVVPIVGEISDVAWAPIAALALRSMFGSNTVFALEFVEEILPLTDFIPLATIW